VLCWGSIGDHSFPRIFHDPRWADREGRAFPRLALDRDVAARHLTEPLADREPEAGAAVFARRRCIGLGKFLEQLAHLFRRHADAGISDGDGNQLWPWSPILLQKVLLH
jgi:hypothetical protein